MPKRRVLRSRVVDLIDELRARRSGRIAFSSGQARAIRHIVGPTGYLAQNTLGPAAEGATAFNKSFEPRIPPSIHISHADAQRQGIVVPLRERCIEDWPTPKTYVDPYDEMGDELS